MRKRTGGRGFAAGVGLALASLLSTGCEHAPLRGPGGLLSPSTDPYQVYRPAYDTPKPNERFLNGYAGFNYGRLRDWGRVRARPGEATAPVIDTPAPPSS